MFDTDTGEEIHTLEGHKNVVYAIAFNNPYGDKIITGSFDKTCKLWDANTGECYYTLRGHASEIVCLGFNPQSTVIATGSMDNTAKLWDVETRTEVCTLAGHTAVIVSLCFNTSGDTIVTGGFDDQFASAGGAFGAGIYFSPEACKSMNYTGKYLVVVEAALGLEQNRLTCKQPERNLDYDTVFKQMGKRSCQCHVGAPFNHEERIVYHPTQCKPVYLIELVTPGRNITGRGC